MRSRVLRRVRGIIPVLFVSMALACVGAGYAVLNGSSARGQSPAVIYRTVDTVFWASGAGDGYGSAVPRRGRTVADGEVRGEQYAESIFPTAAVDEALGIGSTRGQHTLATFVDGTNPAVNSIMQAALLPGGDLLGAEQSAQDPSREPVLRIITINVNKTNVGDAHLIITPSGKAMLIDAGLPKCGTRVVLPLLRAEGVNTIDWLMVSHPHQDHMGGIPEILRSSQVTVKQVLWSTVPYEKMEAYEPRRAKECRDLVESIKTACSQRGVPVREVSENQTYDLGDGVRGEILAAARPDIAIPTNYINNNSIVMRLTFGRFAMLFAGDQGFEEEARVLACERSVTADVLKVGHHAGAGATGAAWLEAVHPKVAVACMPQWLSADDRGQRVHEELDLANIGFYRTWECGQIEVRTDGIQCWMMTEGRRGG